MNFEIFTSCRYLRSKKDNLFISKLLLISILTVTLAISIPIVVLSVINGFHQSIKEKVISADFQYRLRDRYYHLSYYNEILTKLRGMPNVKLAIPFFESKGLISINQGESIRFVTVKAFYNKDILLNHNFTKTFKIISKHSFFDYIDKTGKEMNSNLKEKEYFKKVLPNLKSPNKINLGNQKNLNEYYNNKTKENDNVPFQVNKIDGVVIGDALSRYINVYKEDKIKLLIPQGDIILDSDPENFKTLTVENFYSANYARFNKSLIFINLKAVESVFGLSKIPTDIGINFKDGSYINKTINLIKKEYPDLLITNTLEEGIFKDFAQEKKMMKFLLYFLVVSAFLTIFIALHVVIMDKRKEIGILKAIGAKSRTIQLIFIFEGLFISFIGVILGNLLGFLITLSLKEVINFIEAIINRVMVFTFDIVGGALNLNYPNKFYFMDPSVFYLKTFPYQFNYSDILLQSVGAIFVSLLASYFPSKKASMQKPAESIRL
jgi:lipoprotein-releasing system permease protein